MGFLAYPKRNTNSCSPGIGRLALVCHGPAICTSCARASGKVGREYPSSVKILFAPAPINSGSVNSTGSVSAGNGSSYIASDNSGLWRWGPPAIVYTGNFCNCNGYPTVSGYASVPVQGVPGGYYNANVIQQPNGCNGFGWPVYNCLVSPVNAAQCEVYITSPGGDPAPWAEWLLNVSDSACYRS